MKIGKIVVAYLLVITMLLTVMSVFADAETGVNYGEIEYDLTKATAIAKGDVTIGETMFDRAIVCRKVDFTQNEQYIEYLIDVPEAGEYFVQLLARMSSANEVYIDNTKIGDRLVASKDGWYKYNVGTYICTAPGEKVLKILTKSGGKHSIYVSGLMLYKNQYYYDANTLFQTATASDPSESELIFGSGDRYRNVTFRPDGINNPQLESIAVGKSLTLSFDVLRTGKYIVEVNAKLGGKGLYDVYLERNLMAKSVNMGGIIQNLPGELAPIQIGTADLKKGKNLMTLTCTGSTGDSSYNLAVYSIKLTLVKAYAEDDSSISPVETIDDLPGDSPMDAAYQKAYASIAGLGLLQKTAFTPDGQVKRGEFTQYLMNLMNLRGLNSADARQTFSDVPPGAKCYTAVEALYDLGIVAGRPDGTFGINDVVTVADAARMLLRIIVGRNVPENASDYSKAYRGVMRNVEDGVLHGKQLAVLLYNALETEMLTTTAITTSIQSETKEYRGENILTRYLGYTLVKGRVTANSMTGLYGVQHAVPQGYVQIENTLYKVGDTNIDDAIGREVRAYCDDAIDTKTVQFFAEEGNKTVVTAKDLLEYKNGTLYYYGDGDRKSSIRIPQEACILYNGKAYNDCKGSEFMIRSGEIEFIYEKNSDVVSVVRIYAYGNFLVTGVNYNKEAIYTTQASNVDASLFTEAGVILLDSEKYDVRYFADGMPTDMSRIRQDAVLTIGVSKNKTGKQAVLVHIVKNSIKGVVESVGEDALVLNGSAYGISDSLKHSGVELHTMPGRDGVFYLDLYSEVAFADLERYRAREMYGYLAEMELQNTQFGIQFTIFGTDGKFNKYSGASKLYINGDRVSGNDFAYSDAWYPICEQYYEGGVQKREFKPQLVVFRLNIRDEISAIYTVSEEKDAPLRYGLSAAFTAEYDAKPSPSMYYVSSSKYFIDSLVSFNNGFKLDDETIIMRIPAYDFKNLSGYELAAPALFLNEAQYDVKAYNVDEFNNADIVIYKERAAEKLNSNYSGRYQYGFIKKVQQILENDRYGYRITVLLNGKESTYVLRENNGASAATYALASALKPGDWIGFYAENREEPEIKSMQYVSEIFSTYGTQINPKSSTAFSKITVLARRGTEIVVNTPDQLAANAGTTNVTCLLDNANIYIMHADRGELTIGSIEDVAPGDVLYARVLYCRVKDALIVR